MIQIMVRGTAEFAAEVESALSMFGIDGDVEVSGGGRTKILDSGDYDIEDLRDAVQGATSFAREVLA